MSENKKIPINKMPVNNANVIVSTQGVAFGNCWFSHEKILGRQIDDKWEAGKPLEPRGLIERQYFAWVEQALNATTDSNNQPEK